MRPVRRAGAERPVQVPGPAPTPASASSQSSSPVTAEIRASDLPLQLDGALRPPDAAPVPAVGRPREVTRALQVTGWNFDWDDNIFFMPTRIWVHHKETGEKRGVSTHEFALVREQIGKSGPFKDYEMRPDALADFGDVAGENRFARDVLRALEQPGWQGPSWRAFVRALSRKETARHTTLITARLHSPETIHEGLKLLKERGLIRHVPPLENIFPVSHPALAKELGGGTATNPSAAKAVVMARILDKIQASGLADGARRVVPPDGGEKRRMHLWGFSDDDYGNYQKAVVALSEQMKPTPEHPRGRWPDVKITVFFTGKNHPTEKPRVEILTPGGGTRPYSDREHGEAARILAQLSA